MHTAHFTPKLRRGFIALGMALMTTLGAAQDPSDGRGPATPPRGPAREAMWPAPTAEDWKKPVLLTFQRTWKDAVAVSQETGKPILVCINMDGEIASEHYAGVRYREPAIAKLYEQYVCVMASVYRHNPRDHDDKGQRILCPRFGSVTCSEHIWIEPLIFEKFCDGQRVAPRHICVDLKGGEVYDIYYRNDTASVFADIKDNAPKREARPNAVVRGDRPLLERVASRDIRDRTAVESAYKNGDKAMRQSLLDAAMKHKQAEQIDLMRLAIFGLDADASKTARKAISAVETADAADLLSDAMRVPMEQSERTAIIAALKRLGKVSPRARWLAGVHEGLAGTSTTVDVRRWLEPQVRGGKGTTGGGVYTAGFASDIESRALAAVERPKDPMAHLDLAETTLALALKAPLVYADNPRMARLITRQLYEDAQLSLTTAEELGATGWRIDAVAALGSYYSGDRDAAYPRAIKAVKELPPGHTGWSSMAVVTIFAEARWKAIKAAVREGKELPPEWLRDLNSAYTILLKHPLGTEGQVLWHYELLNWLGARYRSVRVLRDGLGRFQDSAALHQKLRERVLKFRGPNALRETYDAILKEQKDPTRMLPFAGRASIDAAHQFRRVRGYEKAMESYIRAIELYEKAIKADERYRATLDPAIALAYAGIARVAYQLEDDHAALKAIVASFERSPGTAGTRDGMGITPGETAQMLLNRLKESKQEKEAAQLSDALAKIEADLLRPDIGLTPK